MTDELDLTFGERRGTDRRRGSGAGRRTDSDSRAGQRRRGTRRRGGSRGPILMLVVVAVLLAGLGSAYWYGPDRIQSVLFTPDYSGAGTGAVTIEVGAGETATDIAATLVDAGVVRSAAAFVDAAQSDSRSQSIQPGRYTLRTQMKAETALAMLLDLGNKISNQVTIPEGRSTKQTLDLLAEASGLPVAQFQEAAADPIALGVPDWWFERTDGQQPARSVEGFLYPDTYALEPNMTAEQILQTMVGHFLTVTEELDFADRVTAERGISPYEALIAASLAQSEAGTQEDLGKVARVAYNRVYGDFPCGCLEMDVTVNYWLEATGQPTKTSSEMTQDELIGVDNPYSRKLRGMVPTPINNPGRLALEGAMDPPAGGWLFFVAIDKQGRSAFAETYSEHLENEATARANGII
ncbi:endolytic transglycosylase MltG [Micromonospora sp. NBC_01813]|uniref:endolytic transglycosylase MltG n=1 Tax=Micromonospora sp. NBC_01813 TaxID=2975988 RepID=UPI002DD95C82|nr:endolytic transglycosylase MltG [Micromonospora sp. NBC_01813]WSA07167.1 endolytic transglycosylase MltG [Micromonospora sp. NBC_01813]